MLSSRYSHHYPGELITREVADHITYAAEKGCSVIGLSEGNTLQVLDL